MSVYHATRHVARGTWIAAIGGFLLPWQTVWLLRVGTLAGQPYALANVGIVVGDLVLAALAVFGVWRGERRARIAVLLAALALGIVAVANVSRSPDPLLSGMGWARLAMAVLAVGGITALRQHARAFLSGFLAAMGVHALLGVLQFLSLATPALTMLGISARTATRLGESVIEAGGGRWLRAYGGFPHPNIFGTALLCALLTLATWTSRSADTRAQRILRAVAVASFTFVLVLTFSRAAWVGAVVLFGVLAVRPRTQDIALAGALTLIAAFTVLWPFVATRFDATERLERIAVQQRVTASSDARALLGAQPLVGIGLHAMPLAIAEQTPERDPYTIEPVHNVPLLMLVEVGAIGVGVIAAALAAMLLAAPGLVAPWTLLALLPTAMVDHHLWSLPVGATFLMVAAAVLVGRQPEPIDADHPDPVR